jgi:hypothetical protein
MSKGGKTHRDQASDSGEVVTPFMQDGTYPTRNVENENVKGVLKDSWKICS